MCNGWACACDTNKSCVRPFACYPWKWHPFKGYECDKECVSYLGNTKQSWPSCRSETKEDKERRQRGDLFAQPHDDLPITSILPPLSSHHTYADLPYMIHNNSNPQYGRTLLLIVVPLGWKNKPSTNHWFPFFSNGEDWGWKGATTNLLDTAPIF